MGYGRVSLGFETSIAGLRLAHLHFTGPTLWTFPPALARGPAESVTESDLPLILWRREGKKMGRPKETRS